MQQLSDLPPSAASARPALPAYTVSRDRPAGAARAIASVAAAFLKVRPSIASTDLGSVLAEARGRTGLTDWGDDGFLTSMGRLLEEAARCDLAPLGRLILHQVAVSAVVHRLRLYRYVAQHPEVRSVPIERPIFIVGFPRSGTTLMQNLLAVNPANRALRFWELVSPVPAHPDPTVDRWMRRSQARALVRAAYLLSPEQRVIHAIGVDTAEECWPLFQIRAMALNNDLMSGFTEYGTWLLQQDLTPAYEEYRLQLQVLTHQRPGRRLILKCPEHLWFLDPLVKVFPDARVVWTHRDPVDCVASYCSMASLQIRNMRGRVDRPRLGAHLTERFVTGVERAMAARERNPDAHVLDVQYEAFAADPAGTVRAIEAWSGGAPSADTERRVAAWLTSGRSDGAGRHVYSADRFGLDVAELARRFRPYTERYGVRTGR